MALTKLQAEIIKSLAASSLKERFYWTGGTLLSSKYLQHRRSDDIDLFTGTPFSYQEAASLVKILQAKVRLKKIEEKKIFDRWEFFLHNHGQMRLDFVYYNFPCLQKRKKWLGVFVDSLPDIAANKVMAAIDRHEPKDAVDIYFLIKKAGFSPKKLLALARKKFGLAIDESTLWGEFLRGSKNLKEIQALLYGTTSQQKKIVEEIQDYFAESSAAFLHGRWH